MAQKELPYVAVLLSDAETARNALGDAGLRASAQAVKITVEDPARPVDGAFERLAIPVTDLQEGFDLLRAKGIEVIPGLLNFEAMEERERIPYDHLGEIAILREGGRGEAADVMERHPRIRTVYLTKGIDGELRTPVLELLSGPDEPRTIMRESGLDIEIDVRKTYFSPRLAHERERVATLARKGEHILDMFCGVGPFILHFARKGCTVTGIDLNPAAIDLARENAERNGFADSVQVRLGDASDVVPALVADGLKADRIVMNHPTSAMGFLDTAAAAIDEGTIHLYLMVERGGLDTPMDRIRKVLGDRVSGIIPHQVRSVGPGEEQWCFDVEVA